MVDSNVVRCAASKGRSSSRALSPFLCKYGALCLSGGIYFSLPFVPTRLNTSDDPTRDRDVRDPHLLFPIDQLSEDDVEALARVPGLRRWASNWIRHFVGFPKLAHRRASMDFDGLYPMISQMSYGLLALPWSLMQLLASQEKALCPSGSFCPSFAPLPCMHPLGRWQP